MFTRMTSFWMYVSVSWGTRGKSHEKISYIISKNQKKNQKIKNKSKNQQKKSKNPFSVYAPKDPLAL